MRTLTQAFTQHPASVDETYLQHLCFATGFSIRLFGAGLAALIHAILPFLFEKTASQAICRMHDHIVNR